MPVNLSALSIKGIILDIEGTTTSVGFVYDVLFPYARKHMKDYITKNFSTPDMQNIIQLLRKEHETDVAKWAEPPHWDTTSTETEQKSILNYLLWMMDKDRKSPALKRIQGRIWEKGYRSGELRGDLFADVSPALKRWSERGIQLHIYSSGSVLAQKLLFSHTKEGDITRFFHRYFDTKIGPKTSADSYRRISRELKCPSQNLLFISDQAKELDPAKQAGMHAVLCVRASTSAYLMEEYPAIQSFDEVN